MTVEAGIEDPATYIDSLDDNYPASGDDLVEGDNHVRGIKNTLKNTLPNVTGAITSTHTELNLLDGCTASTTELNYNDITTPGIIEPTKTVTADASGYVTFNCNAAVQFLAFDTSTTNSYLYGDQVGRIGAYDNTNSAYIYEYTPNATPASRLLAITPPTTIATLTATNLTVNTSLTMPASTVDTAELADGAATSDKIGDGALIDSKHPTYTGTPTLLVVGKDETYSTSATGVMKTYGYLIALRSGSYNIAVDVVSTADHRVTFVKNGATTIYTIDGTPGSIPRGGIVALVIGDVVDIQIGAINIAGSAQIDQLRIKTTAYFPMNYLHSAGVF